MVPSIDSFRTRSTQLVAGQPVELFSLTSLVKSGFPQVLTLPYCLRILLENLLRHEDERTVTRQDILAAIQWNPESKPSSEVNFRPSRVLLQDFTGVPAMADLAAMREAFVRLGGDAQRINPIQPSDLVIDHSVQVDAFGNARAFQDNIRHEFARNEERYRFLKWSQTAFQNMRVVPPGTGIVHQVNLECLATLLCLRQGQGATQAFPDSLVGTDSHTTMINGLGVVGWGVGGIEAEAAMLGQPIGLLLPEVVGFRLRGKLPTGTTATDLVLTVTQLLRTHGVVDKFVEFFGDGLASLSLPDRATIANMAPEYGATVGYFPVDAETLSYLRFTGRDPHLVDAAEDYYRLQGLLRTDDSPEPRYSSVLTLDLAEVQPCLAGPRRPQDRLPLRQAKAAWQKELAALPQKAAASAPPAGDGLQHGSVVIAAITSCTNTSNPAVMVAAGLLAKRATELGLQVKPWVKTSLAPGSQVVTEYLREAGLLAPLAALHFNLVGYGCTTCIGNSGALPDEVASAVQERDLVVCSVLSGNRNFEGRIHPMVRANYLMSPPLVVAYAIAGTMDIDFDSEPLGQASDGTSVFLRDVWPEEAVVQEVMRTSIKREHYTQRYGAMLEGPEAWQAIQPAAGNLFAWESDSTYIRKPPFFDGLELQPATGGGRAVPEIRDARVLLLLGDSVTTDHISPAGNIDASGPAAAYLRDHGIDAAQFNSFGSRRGNHEVMVRGTFANVRLRNLLAPGTEGGITVHLPDGVLTSVYDAAMRYEKAKVPLLVIAGKEYGTGSSRDWAAKGPRLLGVRAVIAESFERIHRSNLVGMGILPLQFVDGQSASSLGLSGRELYRIEGIEAGLTPGKRLTVHADEHRFSVVARLNTPQEVEYLHHGGILPFVLRQMAQPGAASLAPTQPAS